MQNKIFYIGYYSSPSIIPERNIPLAGRNKMDYTIDALKNIFDCVEIISMANTKDKRYYAPSVYQEIKEGVYLKLFKSYVASNRLFAFCNYLLLRIQLFCYLLANVKCNDTVLVYHSLAYKKWILRAKKIIGFKFVLELNEIYSDVAPKYEKYRSLEIANINIADGFLFANDLMNGLFNVKNKPFAVGYGIYKIENKVADKFNDDFIHLVYAGTLDPDKGGASAAIAAAKYLPSNYHIHILGFGTPEMIKAVEIHITKMRVDAKCRISYDGVYDGSDFMAFLQKCHIGLSTQNPNASFNDTSFPSKILTYLANGLQVVSIAIPAISRSQMKDDITFYQEQTPEDIASAIMKINDFTPRYRKLNNLDRQFRIQIQNLFAKI